MAVSKKRVEKHLYKDGAKLKGVCRRCGIVLFFLWAYQFTDAGWRYVTSEGLVCGCCLDK